jgi:probable rRNA maturation factor
MTATRRDRARVRAAPAREFSLVSTASFIVEDRRWRDVPGLLALLRRAARLAASGPPDARTRSAPPFSVLLADSERLRALNGQFRGKDKSTNVLSFPAARVEGHPYLGDIALAYGVVAEEAAAQNKDFAAHAAHLVIHGVLHLQGHDHENASDAARMEGLEIRLLAELGIANPYAPRAPIARGPVRSRRKAL